MREYAILTTEFNTVYAAALKGSVFYQKRDDTHTVVRFVHKRAEKHLLLSMSHLNVKMTETKKTED